MVKYNGSIEAQLSALADPTRHSILLRLTKEKESPVSVIAKPFEKQMSLPAVSKHLRVLENAQLVRVRRSGRNRLYSVNAFTLGQIKRWVNTSELFWLDAIDRLARYVETKA